MGKRATARSGSKTRKARSDRDDRALTEDTPRGRLLAAARKVLERDGVGHLTLRAIAREAGVSHGAPLRHFPTLSALLAELAAEGFEQLVGSVDAELSKPRAAKDPRQRLARAGYAYVHFALSEPGVYSVMFRPDLLRNADLTDIGTPFQHLLDAGDAAFGQLLELVIAAQGVGWRDGEPTDQVAGVVWALVHGLADLWLHGALQVTVDVKTVDQLLELAVLPEQTEHAKSLRRTPAHRRRKR